MDIKELFDKAEDGVLTYEQFTEAAKEAGAKFTDLNEGKYVSKEKFEDKLAEKVAEIETLNGTISTRDTDLAELQKRLEEVGVDGEKLAKLTADFDSLNNKYKEEKKSYEAQLQKQAYEFAVKQFANDKKFTSNAAKRDFIQSMLGADLKVENGSIFGAEDFAKQYAENNADAFLVEKAPEPEPDVPKPQFVSTTHGAEDYTPDVTSEFANAFHFAGVRSNED